MAAKQLKVNSFTTRQFVADGLLVKQLAVHRLGAKRFAETVSLADCLEQTV
jgi:hypothetical protein